MEVGERRAAVYVRSWYGQRNRSGNPREVAVFHVRQKESIDGVRDISASHRSEFVHSVSCPNKPSNLKTTGTNDGNLSKTELGKKCSDDKRKDETSVSYTRSEWLGSNFGGKWT